MDTLDRFLVREFLNFFFLIVLGLAVLYLGIDFLSKYWDLKLSFTNVIHLYLYKIPSAIQLFVPVASLMACLLVLSSMSRENEILALYTSGIGNLRIASTFVAIVALLSTASFLLFDSIVPWLNRRQILLTQGLDPGQENMSTVNRERFWYRSGPLIYYVGRFLPQQNKLENVNVFVTTHTFRIAKKIHAKQAWFQDNDWTLEDGFITRYPTETHYPISETFASHRGIIPERPSDFKILTFHEETLKLKELRKHINRNTFYGMDTTASQVNYHERIALVFTPLIFVLMGFPFAVSPLRTHPVARSIAFCFITVFAYLILFRMTLSLGRGGQIPPLLAGWLPNGAFFLYGLVSLLRKR